MDKEKNNICQCKNSEFEISTSDSKIKIYVIPTDEEIVFIEDVVALLNGTYDDPDKYVYPFQLKDYVNNQRKIDFEKDLQKRPALKSIVANPK